MEECERECMQCVDVGRERGPVPREHFQRLLQVDISCRLLKVPLFRGSGRFESLILSHHFRCQLYMRV